MKILIEKEATKIEVGYGPDSEILSENPPRFIFMPAEESAKYIIQVSTTKDFSKIAYEFADLDLSFYTPEHIFAPGKYYWRYALYSSNEIVSTFSKIRSFSINEKYVTSPLISRKKRYENIDYCHPRLWLKEKEIIEVRHKVEKDAKVYQFDLFYENSVRPWVNKKTPLMLNDFNYDWTGFENDFLTPEPPLNKEKNRKRWRSTYITCQEVLYKIKHLAIAGRILNDSNLINEAKELLVHIATWDVSGSTGHDSNDEACYRVTQALAWGYDYLMPYLNDKEKKVVRQTLYVRLKETFIHMVERAKIHVTPYNSHPIRSLNMVVIPACIVLLGYYPEVENWLNYAIEYMYAIYTPWGKEDGGYSEGCLYWTTAMASAFEGMNSLNFFLNINVYERLFFQKTGDFILYCYSPKTIRSTFGDQSNLGKKVSLKTGFLMRQLASVTQNEYYQYYYETFLPWNTSEFTDFFNYGWWDFYFENFLHLHSFKSIKSKKPADVLVKIFNDVGIGAMHYKYTDPKNHIQLLFKSSPYGSISHSHADQNAFNLHAFGEPLAVETGYYYDYGGKMHSHWCKQTISENCLLIDSCGQYTFDVDLVYETLTYQKANVIKQIEANGSICAASINNNYSYFKGDATNAYLPNVPALKKAIREIYFVDNSYFVIKDSIDLTEEKDISFLFHTLYKMTIEKNSFKVNGKKASLDGHFIFSLSPILKISQHDLFSGVPEEEYANRDRQWHLNMTTSKALCHRLITVLLPYKNNSSSKVNWLDEESTISIFHAGKAFKITKD